MFRGTRVRFPRRRRAPPAGRFAPAQDSRRLPEHSGSLFPEMMEKLPSTAPDIDHCGVFPVGEPTADIMAIGPSQFPARCDVERRRLILKVGRILLVDAVAVGCRSVHFAVLGLGTD